MINNGGIMNNKLSVQSIDKKLKEVSYNELPNFLEKIRFDSRIGVQKLVEKYERKYKQYQQELTRVKKLNEYENYYYKKGLNYIAGIDEAGRGPLAGPVVAAAVILPKESTILGINDSKKLSPTQREELFNIIKEQALAIGIGIINPEIIDKINILQSTFQGMKQAIEQLKIIPDQLLIDGSNPLPNVSIPQDKIIKGDGKSISIAAASIIAKVTRDRVMDTFHYLYPQYGFIRHKGYGTKEHLEAIKKYGLCPIHRKSFTNHLF